MTIFLLKGDSSDFADSGKFLVFEIDTELDLTRYQAYFELGRIKKTIQRILNNSIGISLTAEDTSKLPFGSLEGTLKLIDPKGNVKTLTNTIPFYITDEVINASNDVIKLELLDNPEVKIRVIVGGGVTSINGKTGEVELTPSDLGFKEYVLPPASSSELGGVLITENGDFLISPEGSLSLKDTIPTEYEDLKNLPKINGTTLAGSKSLDDLGIQPKGSYATPGDLDKKVDKVLGKSLISDTEIARLATLENYNDIPLKQELQEIENSKVDKVLGKQLSTNDFTDDLKNKLTITDPEARVHSVNGQVGKVTIPIPDISPLATKQELEDGLATKQTKGDYASKSEVNSKAEKSYVDTELNKKADKTEIPDISNLATKDEIPAPYTLPTASTTTLGGVKVDGTTITINNGVISSSGGSGEAGTTNYNDLLNKPQINGVELSGNKTLDNLGIQAKGDYALKSSIPTKTSQLTNDSNFLTEHQDISNLATKSELNNKVDKVSGKQLSTNDFTTDLKNKLDSVDVNAKVYSVNGKTGAVTIDVPDTSDFATKDDLNSLVQAPTSTYSNPALYVGSDFNSTGGSLDTITVAKYVTTTFNKTITITEDGYYNIQANVKIPCTPTQYGDKINFSALVNDVVVSLSTYSMPNATNIYGEVSGVALCKAGDVLSLTLYSSSDETLACVLNRFSAVRVYSPFDLDLLTPKVVEDLTSTAITIAKAEANTTYKCGTITSLTITEVEDSPLDINVIFTTGTTAPTINLPATLESINISEGFEVGKKYVLAIQNNIAVIGSIE